MTPLSSEAERLADELTKWARNYAGTTYEDDMATQAADLLRRIPELEAERDQLRAELEGRWLPIESAPKDGTEFLGFRRGAVATSYRVPRDDCEMWVFGQESGSFEHWPQVRPTHWRPLPPPPTTQEGDK